MRTSASSARTGVEASPKLSREALVDAAVVLADAEGLDALTIRRLAREIGVTPMALYWHVKDKDQLMEALGDWLFLQVELPAETGGSWHEELRSVLAALLEQLARHPALAPLALPTILTSGAGLAAAERILSLLRRAGLEDAALGDLGAYLLSSIVTLVTAQPGHGVASETAEKRLDFEVKRSRLLSLDANQFPCVVSLADHLLDCDDQQRYFGRGLDLLVLGLRGLTARGAGSPRQAE